MNNPIFEPAIQDMAINQFRSVFNIPLVSHTVSNGRILRMRVVSPSRATEYLAIAQTIILVNRLPLTVGISEWKVGGCIFDRWLQVEFDSSKLVPENY
jgi:hypothetical protein